MINDKKIHEKVIEILYKALWDAFKSGQKVSPFDADNSEFYNPFYQLTKAPEVASDIKSLYNAEIEKRDIRLKAIENMITSVIQERDDFVLLNQKYQEQIEKRDEIIAKQDEVVILETEWVYKPEIKSYGDYKNKQNKLRQELSKLKGELK